MSPTIRYVLIGLAIVWASFGALTVREIVDTTLDLRHPGMSTWQKVTLYVVELPCCFLIAMGLGPVGWYLSLGGDDDYD